MSESSKKPKGPTASGRSSRRGAKPTPRTRERPRDVRGDPTPTDDEEPPPKKGVHGVPGSKNDSRRCTATAHRTGERCKAPAIKGGTVCRVHGGAAPQVKKAARDRLLELVDPAISQLAKLLNRDDVDDGTRLRAIQMLLDRTGNGPSANIKVEDNRWDALLAEVGGEIAVDRSLPEASHNAIGDGSGEFPLGYEDAEQHFYDANAEAWRQYDAEDAAAYAEGRIRPDENTVQGEVVPEVDRFGEPMKTREQLLLDKLDDRRDL